MELEVRANSERAFWGAVARIVNACYQSLIEATERPEARCVRVLSQELTCTINEAYYVTALGRTKLYELIGDGHLATTTVGRRRLVVVRSLLSLLESKTSV
jgi:hypothetical protein